MVDYPKELFHWHLEDIWHKDDGYNDMQAFNIEIAVAFALGCEFTLEETINSVLSNFFWAKHKFLAIHKKEGKNEV